MWKTKRRREEEEWMRIMKDIGEEIASDPDSASNGKLEKWNKFKKEAEEERKKQRKMKTRWQRLKDWFRK